MPPSHLFTRRTLLASLPFAAFAGGKPRSWPSDPPADCPFAPARRVGGIAFTGVYASYERNGPSVADTWYPSWASDDRMYSPYTDGACPRGDGTHDHSDSGRGERSTTGCAVIEGTDPLNLTLRSLGLHTSSALPYQGRYPCGSLVYNGIWYYGTYTLGPAGQIEHDGIQFNWPWLGPFVGFRTSADFGRSWTETPHTPAKPIFGENGLHGDPVKIGSPHFVDFGRNLQHSPDGKAYLVSHGAIDPDPKPRYANASWITGDQIFLLRVEPSLGAMNEPSAYEFFAGHDSHNRPIWTRDFARVQPLLDWNNHCGCVTATYIPGLKLYLMCITDGWPTAGRMSTSIFESQTLTGPWRLVTYLKDFGQQAYFVHFPSRFLAEDGRSGFLCYSANFATDWGSTPIRSDPPGSRYGLVLQQVLLPDPKQARALLKR
jgi:hypothetical protein